MFTGILLSISMLLANDSASTAFVLPSPSTGFRNLSKCQSIRRTETSIFYRDDGNMDVGVERSPHDTKSTASSSSWKHIIEKRVSPIAKPSPTSSSPSDFQSRMKRVIVQNKKRTSGAVASYRPSNIKNVISLEEFANVIEKGRRESKVVVVRFIATWCKVRIWISMKLFMSYILIYQTLVHLTHLIILCFLPTLLSFQTCHSLRPHFDKTASTNPNVIFVEVPVLEHNANLHRGLGVESVPFGHIYHPKNGLVEETKLSRNTFSEFENMIKMHSSS